jgi:hypothetical protein
MLNTSHREPSHSPAASRHPVLDRLSWTMRVQLAELAASLREYNALRTGTYMFRGAFCSLDSEGRPVVVIELGSDESGLASRRVVTFANVEDASDFVSQDMYFYALRAASGLVRAQAWRKCFPTFPSVSDETFELGGIELESGSLRVGAVLQ